MTDRPNPYLHPVQSGAKPNKALGTIFEKGRAAGLAGRPRRAPYTDTRTRHGGVTYSRACINAWLRGYDGWPLLRHDRQVIYD